MFQTFISRHNSNFFSDKLVLTSVTPASSAPVLQTPKATSSTLYFDSLTVNAGNGGFLHCIQMDTSVNAANQVVSVGADIAFDADPKFFACLVRFESSSVPTTLPTAYDVYRIKLLEEILSFRMQGVEFDNGDMYVDGHKAASDVRDEFVSVTEKLMDELAQCYNVLPQLDINNTIDHRPE